MRPSVHIPLSHRSLAAAFLAALSPWTTTSMVQAGEGSGSIVDIAQREITRRQQRIFQASEEELAGDKAMAERDYQAGLTHYRAALDLLPDAEVDRDQRERVIGKYVDASIKLAQQRADGGEYDAARSLLDSALFYDPDSSRARRLRERLDDPEWFNPANSKEHMTNVQEVRKHLELGLGHFDLGEFDKARDEFNRVLNIDRYNTAAQRQLERTERRISEHHLASRDHTRAQMLRRVDEQWETAVPSLAGAGAASAFDLGGGVDSSQVILDKMRTLIIPSVALDQVTVEEAVEFLRLKSRELDTVTVDPSRRGVNFILRLAPTGPTPRITNLNLSNVPLDVAVKAVADMAGLRSRVEPYAVIISPADTDTELYTKVFRVPPDFLSQGGSAGAGADAGAAADPFAPGGGGGGGGAAAPARPRATAKEILQSAGISFPEQGTAFFSSATSTLTVRNTPANLDLVSQFVESISGKVSKLINITSKFIEVNQKNTDEFGFDWLVGAFNIGGDRVFGSGGTAGNRGAGPVGATNWPFVPPGQAGTPLPVGGSNLATGGLRFGDNAISNNAIDGLLSTSATAEGTPEASVTPSVFGIAGVFTDPQFQVVLRALNQKKGTDLLTAPAVTTRSGQRAKVEVIREFIYPTEFEPPEIPQDFGGGLTVGGAGVGAQSSGFPVTPTTPTAFETRNTGVTLEVEPTLGADGYTIDLTLAPEVVEFEGFINYGSPIQSSATDALGNPTTIVLTENRIEQPVFSTRKLSTSVTIWDGMTLGVGGLISDATQTVEDKVPIFGDVPYFGRFFRTKADQFFKKNLTMFVTVTLIDPSGQRVNQNRFVNPSGLEAPPPDTGAGPALMPDMPPDNLK